ncbi:MAG: 2'-5' RNA ligase family protein, partial [Chloroflexota bacterium]
EGRPFAPHLTLARLGEGMAPPHLEAFGRLAQATPWQPGHPFTVDGVNLMRSQLTPQGAIYTCLHRAGLAPSPTDE